MSRGGQRLAWVAVAFLGVSLITRVGLALFSGDPYNLSEWGRFLGLGVVFDVAVLLCFLLPWALYDALLPATLERRWARRAEAVWSGVWAVAYLSFFLVIAAAEFAFWGEFASRFDFIAVDYLVYTHEVLGNIEESYPVGLWLAAIVAVAAAVWWKTWPRSGPRSGPRFGGRAPASWPVRWARVAVLAAGTAVGLASVDIGLAGGAANAYVEQLSLNGVFALFHAYRHNELDYARYYPELTAAEREARIRTLLREPHAAFLSDTGIDRRVSATHPLRPVNVVLISVESLSAEFLGRFGDNRKLTPELDRLAGEGLLFTNLYATGTRTVRGLEALSIGTPPTPGQSIVRRPNNAGLENIGEEFAGDGWKTYWIYGGYGLFDNMNAYFGANNYTVVDRSAMDEEGLPIHAENIWGIADEDLYSLALRKFDQAHDGGQPFFAHIMTTSNHRPYTFPEGRVPLPQKHREGAVQYTDWAIGDFLRRAKGKPWFDDTLFIITADHTAKAAGKTDLPPARYHIPMIWYAPKLVTPGVMERLMSQVDVGPTLMGWMGMSYNSRFFGYDMFALEPGRERAFISTYQKLGYLKDGRLVVLDVKKDPEVMEGVSVGASGPQESDAELIKEAIAWYQSASEMFSAGRLKDLDDDEAEAEERQALITR